MKRDHTRKSVSFALIVFTVVASLAIVGLGNGGISRAASVANSSPKATQNNNPLCGELGTKIQGSTGMQAWCFGSQPNGPSNNAPTSTNPSFGSNVDAANPREDISRSGVQAYGQSEESVAGIGPYVVEAWNDSTAFFTSCPAPKNKEEGTGYGFSANGGKSFVDEGGLTNANCTADTYGGDPSVETWQAGGSTYFYVSSLFNSPTGEGPSDIAFDACKASGAGSAATISCSQPIIAGASTQCESSGGFTFCSFLDKDFLSIDPKRGRLYVSYTEFGFSGNLAFGQIELAVCDIGTPSGGTGPLGGTAGAPVCEPGNAASTTGTPYFVVAPGPTCENEGSYPAVDVASGDVYVAYEFNWATNFEDSACFNKPTRNYVNYIPFSCLTLTATSPCAGPSNSTFVRVFSMDAAFVPGYNRFPMNDFPRITVSDKAGTVSIVWNDTRMHPYGDILLQSYNLVSLSNVQSKPLRVNSSTSGWHLMPALRNTDTEGHISISFYGRASANNAITDVYAATGVDPRTTSTPHNMIVTTGSSNWNADSSDITPNFGDYTDNYYIATKGSPYVGNNLFVAWADGRLGDPQPFDQVIVDAL